jgi:hypothetical protein
VTEPKTYTLDVPGAVLTYDVRSNGSSTEPVLLLIGSPNALRAASTRIVVAVGAESGETLARRAALAVADRLGMQPDMFPSHHTGFLGGEYGQTGDPDTFAAKLGEVLAAKD